MENNKNGSNTDDILKIIEQFRDKNGSDAPKKAGPIKPAANDSDVKVVPETEKAQPEKQNNLNAMNSHFSDKADLSKYTTQNSHFSDNAEVKKKKKKFDFGNFFIRLGNMSFLPKAVIYLAFVLVAAVYCSFFAVTGMNDVFALVNTDTVATVTVDENTTIDQVIDSLKEQNVIKYPWLFKIYCTVYEDGTDIELIEGVYEISDDVNFSNILRRLTTVHVERTVVRVTIPEGYTVEQIIDLLVSKGIGTREKYIEAINEYPYKHDFVRQLDAMGYSEDRVYRLEGYLYPDTYDFYTDTQEYLVINKFLNNFNTRFWRYYEEDYKADVEKLGMTFDDIVTMASLVQMEARHIVDYECISYVFHNRLSNSRSFPKLESDATVQYFLANRKEDLTQEDLNTDNPYNTYIYDGLTPGAICNPGLDALEAAIYPAPPINENGYEINAFYFVSDVTGKTYYAQYNSGHEANKKLVEEINRQYDEE